MAEQVLFEEASQGQRLYFPGRFQAGVVLTISSRGRSRSEVTVCMDDGRTITYQKMGWNAQVLPEEADTEEEATPEPEPEEEEEEPEDDSPSVDAEEDVVDSPKPNDSEEDDSDSPAEDDSVPGPPVPSPKRRRRRSSKKGLWDDDKRAEG